MGKKQLLQIASITLTVIGAGISIIAGIVDGKQQDIEIHDAVAEEVSKQLSKG